MNKARILMVTYLVAFLAPSLILAQDSDISVSPLSFLSTNTPRAETSVRLASWNPETGVGHIATTFVYPEGYHQTDNDTLFTVTVEPVPGVSFGSALKGEPVFEEGLASYYDRSTLVNEFRANPGIQGETFVITAHFQICDENGTCLFPDREEHQLFFDSGIEGFEADETVTAVLDWALAPVSQETQIPTSTAVDGSVILFLLMAFVGGILLNIMPCVLPLLSVKALSLVKQAGQERKSILKHAWLYVGGIEASFLALAAVIIALQASGSLLGWGFQFQSPAFVLILTAVIWVFALSLFDVFVIEPPRKGVQGAAAAGAKGGYLGSFLTGIFAVLVATPCTAPFLGAALGFAFSQPPVVIIAIFAATGLGLGLPFLLLGIWPSVIQKLPKPGAWMNTFKEIMGFLLLGTAVYLFTTFAKLAPGSLGPALWWILFLAVAAWILGQARKPLAKRWFRIVGQVAAFIVALASGAALLPFGNFDTGPASTSALSDGKGDVAFREDQVLALVESGEPVFLEFTAAWCTTCKVNQRVLNSQRIQDLMDEKGVVHVVGDLTAYDETMTRWLSDFGRAGVPLYVLYHENGEVEVFPEILSADALAASLERLAGI